MTEIALVRAANSTIAKNRHPITWPIPPIAAKTLGSETNIRLGPEASIPVVPDLSGITLQGFFTVLLDAMGQLFFSLSVAMGIMVTYGSYATPPPITQ